MHWAVSCTVVRYVPHQEEASSGEDHWRLAYFCLLQTLVSPLLKVLGVPTKGGQTWRFLQGQELRDCCETAIEKENPICHSLVLPILHVLAT